MVLSFGQLVIDNEFLRMIRRVLQGIPVSDETLAIDVIKKVGPRGHFLMEEHTRKYMKECQSESKLFDRNTRNDWLQQGATSLNIRAEEEARRIIESHKPLALSDKVQEQLRDIIKQAEKEFMK